MQFKQQVTSLLSFLASLGILDVYANLSQNSTCSRFSLQFDHALMDGDMKESLKKLVDPRLGNDYPIESVMKVS